MFETLLHKAFQIGDKTFHALFDVGSHVDQLEKFALELLKMVNDIRKEAADQEKESQLHDGNKPCDSCIENLPVTDEVKEEPKPAE